MTAAAAIRLLAVDAETGAMMFVAAPLLGLAFVIALPIGGLALATWMAADATIRNWAAAVRRA